MTIYLKHLSHGDGRPKAPSDRDLPPLFDLPQLRKQSDGRLSMVDRHGFVMRPQTLFLSRLKSLYAEATYRSYARALLDIERVNACYQGGKGLVFSKVSDPYLEKTRTEFLKHRKVALGTYKKTMMIAFRFYIFAQDEHFAKNLIGSASDGRKFRINVPKTGIKDHPVMKGKVIWQVPQLPTHRDFELIEAEGMSLIRDPALKRRFSIFCHILKTLALRRSEAARLNIAMVPSRVQLARLRKAAEAGDRAWTVSIKILRSKRGGYRFVEFPISLLEELRDYIDRDRPKDVKGSSKHGPIFVSRKTGMQIGDQWITNLFKRAAKKAAAMHSRGFGEMNLAELRPHHYRHRGITDLLRGFLKEGIDSTEALLVTMSLAGINSLEVIMGYLHVAEAELQEDSDAYRKAAQEREKRSALNLGRIKNELKQWRRRK
ncbi:tyrosine-type recombinase/integrase [Rhizobium leguminosarum bv. viciae]|uniref:tyrosine-type recombinase/integrase n=1 Tax=Rhizobium leguminosarum TaxID=384 RepID=UPI001442380E|nr:tyrosine-type recombinase/integrase [Rhizobium leguminosarum]NKK38555.1 tyrosine-type recombinase/integrase [Rhizobium leguminosarum bv. viciae]